MKPKEKAKELVEKFWTDVEEFKQYETIKMTKEMAKDCALIAVDELIKVTIDVNSDDFNLPDCFSFQYWEEVKQEIELL